jgi:hypothetical protein
MAGFVNIVVVVEEFDKFLFAKGLRFEAVIVGGAALSIMKIANRATKDVDILDETIPN